MAAKVAAVQLAAQARPLHSAFPATAGPESAEDCYWVMPDRGITYQVYQHLNSFGHTMQDNIAVKLAALSFKPKIRPHAK